MKRIVTTLVLGIAFLCNLSSAEACDNRCPPPPPRHCPPNSCLPGNNCGHHRPPQHYRHCGGLLLNGAKILVSFFAHENYCPTEYAYDTSCNRWCTPANGAFLACAPRPCEVITVICGTGAERYYYNARYDRRHNCYHYHDCHGRERHVHCR